MILKSIDSLVVNIFAVKCISSFLFSEEISLAYSVYKLINYKFIFLIKNSISF